MCACMLVCDGRRALWPQVCPIDVQVDGLLLENQELLSNNDKLQQAKAEVTKKLKDVAEKMRHEIEVRARS